MKLEYIAAATVFAFVGGVGCSSAADPAVARHSGGLSSGSAQLAIAGKDAGRIDTVHCAPTKDTTAITVGAEPPVAEATIASRGELSLEWARFRDVNGFTGSYNDGLGDKARVTLNGSTYRISGTASGFNMSNLSRPTTAEFELEVSC